MFTFGRVFGKRVDSFVGKDNKNKENRPDKFHPYTSTFCYFFTGRF